MPPGQGIIGMGKKYSLFPDMATGYVLYKLGGHPEMQNATLFQ